MLDDVFATAKRIADMAGDQPVEQVAQRRQAIESFNIGKQPEFNATDVIAMVLATINIWTGAPLIALGARVRSTGIAACHA